MPNPLNDPPADSLFIKQDPLTNVCTLCHAEVTNSTEHREAHLQVCPEHQAQMEGSKRRQREVRAQLQRRRTRRAMA